VGRHHDGPRFIGGGTAMARRYSTAPRVARYDPTRLFRAPVAARYDTMNWQLIGIGVLAALAIFFVVVRRGGG